MAFAMLPMAVAEVMRVKVVARRSILAVGGVVSSGRLGWLENECGRIDVWRVRGLLQGYGQN